MGAVVRRLYREYVANDAFLKARRRWTHDRGDETLRLDYPLGPKSVVFDVGGYTGDWAAAIHARYSCRVFVFEPVPEFCERIRARFADNPAVSVFDYGLSDRDMTVQMSLAADGSTVYRQGDRRIDARLRDIDAVIRERNIDAIDLIKINIEGGEFALLERMLDRRLIERCRDIQVQFHDFYPDAERMRTRLRERLARTHQLTYDYHFVWENWRRREDGA
jgi:FkbM family methyltransferase